MSLAFITATYVDSDPEDEEGVNTYDDDETKPKISVDSVSPSDKSVKLSRLVSYNDIFANDNTSGDLLDQDQWEEEDAQLSSEPKLPDDINFYPEPLGSCSKELQERMHNYHEMIEKLGLNTNEVIKQKKAFRNPSIYEKLVAFLGIEEQGSNYPPDIYDPLQWGKESYYEALAAAQKEEMEKQMKEKKTKIQVMTGIVKKPGLSSSLEDDSKRKSKWDQKGTNITIPGPVCNTTGFLQKPTFTVVPGTKPSTTAPLTTVPTGTKTSIIPAFGALTKRPKHD